MDQRYVFNVSLPVILAARYLAFIAFGLYRGVWRYAGARDAARDRRGGRLSRRSWPSGSSPRRSRSATSRAASSSSTRCICIVLVGASRFAERALFRVLASLRGRSDAPAGADRRRRPRAAAACCASCARRRASRSSASSTTTRALGPAAPGRAASSAALDEIERVLAQTQPDAVLVTIPNAPRDRLDPSSPPARAPASTCRFVRRELDLEPGAVLGRAAE